MGCNFSWLLRLVRSRSLPGADNELCGGRAARKRSSVVRRDSTFFAIVPLGSAHVGAALENPPTPRSGVRRAGRNREEGSLESSIGGAGALGYKAGVGHGPVPLECMESSMWPMFPARGAGRGVRDHFEGSREPPSGTFGVRNWILRRPQHGFRSFPRHVLTTSFPWGRRQWAQPSRIRRPRGPACGSIFGR